MAIQSTTLASTFAPSRSGVLLPALSLWWREVVRFYRQRARVVGVIASPLLFWIVIGSGFGSSFRSNGAAGGQHYLDYFFPGALTMIVLFTAIFTMMSVIEDRKEGFLLSVLVAPVSRSVIVLGKVLGGATLATLQGLVFLVFAPALGVQVYVCQRRADRAGDLPGCVFADRVGLYHRLAYGFHAGLSRHHQPVSHTPVAAVGIAVSRFLGRHFWLRVLMRINPLTYGTEALRSLLFPGSASLDLSLGANFAVLALFTLVMFALSFLVANRRTTKPAA